MILDEAIKEGDVFWWGDRQWRMGSLKDGKGTALLVKMPPLPIYEIAP